MEFDKSKCISPDWEEINSNLPVEHFHQIIIQEYGSLLNFKLAFLEYCRQKRNAQKKMRKVKKLKPILEVVNSYGLKLKKSGKIFFTLCVFHHETVPSLALYPDSNRFFCFGCGAKGDANDLEAYLKGLEK